MDGFLSLLFNGSKVNRVLYAKATIDIASINAVSTATNTVSCPGAKPGDVVLVGLPATLDAGIVFNAHVSAAGTITLRALNITAGSVNPASADYEFLVFQV